MKNIFIITLILGMASLVSCNIKVQQEESTPKDPAIVAITGPDAIIYQTKGDYNKLVPVILNRDKTEIVSYPAPGDLKYKGKPALPTELEKGFLLDNRGIDENVAFVNITYDEYMALEKTPSVDELMGLIVDYDPLVAMYNCGKRQLLNNEVKDLNTYILDNDFSKFTQIK